MLMMLTINQGANDGDTNGNYHGNIKDSGFNHKNGIITDQYTGIPEDPSVATCGPTPLCVRHELHAPQVSVTECRQCALDVVRVLVAEDLVHLNAEGAVGGEPEPPASPDINVVILANIPRKMYQWCTDGKYIEITSDSYQIYMDYIARCPFIQTLKNEGINVVVEKGLAPLDLAKEQQQQQHLATWIYNFQGLEADTVIFLPGDTPWCKQQTVCDTDMFDTSRSVRTAEVKDENKHTQQGHCRVDKRDDADSRHKTTKTGKSMEERSPLPHVEEVEKQDPATVAARDTPTNSDHRAACEVNTGEAAPSGRTQSREIPAPGVKPGGPPMGLPIVYGELSTSSESAGDRVQKSTRGRDSSVWSITRLEWNSRDIQRFTSWDQTNIVVAGSRCLSLLILIVP